MEEDNVAIRLKLFIEYLGLTNSQFADTCGIPRPSLSQLLSGRNKKISDVIVGQIHRAYPSLSVVWLMFGEGDMISSVENSDDESDENSAVPPDARGANKFSKENGLEMPDFSILSNENKQISKKNNLQNNLEKSEEKPRKVIQITVYYDDNSYETFYPRR